MTRVFISSTAKDLWAYRNAAKEVVLRMGWHPVMVNEHELIPAGQPLEKCMKLAYGCDLFVLLAGYRCGFVPTAKQGGDGKRSITRWELFAWRAKLHHKGGYEPIVFMAQHPTLRCGEGEGRDQAESQVRFRDWLEGKYFKHDFSYVSDMESGQSVAVQKFAANLQTQLAELKTEMIEEKNQRLVKLAARAERRAGKAVAERDKAFADGAFVVGTASAAVAFFAWLGKKQ